MSKEVVVRICQALCVIFIYAGYTASAHALKLEAGDILADFVQILIG